jgi:hypothetical protein
MKKLCIVGYVFGDKYQGFIPLYIYSILKNYPDYSVIIYVDYKLDDNIKKQLSYLRDLGEFEVNENFADQYLNQTKIKDVHGFKKALRWLIFDEKFKKFEAVYIGDVDIFICKETPGLFEQHMKHCEVLNLPYSNFLRKQIRVEKPNIKILLKIMFKVSFKTFINQCKTKNIPLSRLSGLHFIKTEPYFEKITPLFDKYLNIITGKNRDEYYEQKYMLNNESLLYDLIEDSGLGLPPVSPNGPLHDYRDVNSISFRPHHGVHLGIFRSMISVLREEQIIASDIYKEYYNSINELRKNDEIMISIEKNFTPYVKDIFKQMDSYYNG